MLARLDLRDGEPVVGEVDPEQHRPCPEDRPLLELRVAVDDGPAHLAHRLPDPARMHAAVAEGARDHGPRPARPPPAPGSSAPRGAAPGSSRFWSAYPTAAAPTATGARKSSSRPARRKNLLIPTASSRSACPCRREDAAAPRTPPRFGCGGASGARGPPVNPGRPDPAAGRRPRTVPGPDHTAGAAAGARGEARAR